MAAAPVGAGLSPDMPTRFAPTPGLAAAWFGGAPGGDGAGFAAGTLLEAPGGPVPVERLQPGDLLCSAGGSALRVRQVLPGTGAPGRAVLVPADTFGPALPRRDLVLAAHQALWLEGHALAASALICSGGPHALDRSPRLHAVQVLGAGTALAEGLACALRRPIRPEQDPHAGAALAAVRLRLDARGGTSAARAPVLHGTVALGSAGALVGWALDPAQPEAPVLLEALLDDVTIGFILADERRPDLAMAGLGTGACGFAARLPGLAAAWPGGPRLLRLHAVGTGAAMPGTPMLLAPEATALALAPLQAVQATDLARALDRLAATGRR